MPFGRFLAQDAGNGRIDFPTFFLKGSKMKTKLLIGVLIGSALLLAQIAVVGTAALTNEPIPGVDIIVKKNPGGIMVRTQSDASGRFQLGTLSEGRYSVDFDSASLGKAISKIDPESKGPDHTILVVIQLDSPADQPGKPVVSSRQTVRRGPAGQDVSVTFTIPDDPAAGKQKHSYKGQVTLVR